MHLKRPQNQKEYILHPFYGILHYFEVLPNCFFGTGNLYFLFKMKSLKIVKTLTYLKIKYYPIVLLLIQINKIIKFNLQYFLKL